MKPPWDVRTDKEQRALRPVLDLRERLRLGLKVPTPFIAYLWFQADQSAPRAAVAFCAAVGVLSSIELVWLRTTTDRERIFTKTTRQAVILHAVVVAASVLALVLAIPRLP